MAHNHNPRSWVSQSLVIVMPLACTLERFEVDGYLGTQPRVIARCCGYDRLHLYSSTLLVLYQHTARQRSKSVGKDIVLKVEAALLRLEVTCRRQD